MHIGYGVGTLDKEVNTAVALRGLQSFFHREDAYKRTYSEPQRKEWGYQTLPQRETFVVREANVPQELAPCLDLLDMLHELAVATLTEIAGSLDLKPEKLTGLVRPRPFGGSPNPSPLRLLCYHGQGFKEGVACDAHQDLGLLTLVVSSYPALEVFDFSGEGEWVSIEKGLKPNQIVVMLGETLSMLTNDQLLPCTHRVCATPGPRYSIAYQVRAEPEALMASESFETAVTGCFRRPFKMTGAEFLAGEQKVRTSVNLTY